MISTLPRPQYPTVFLDRDGVINENRADHVKAWSEFRFIPGARQAIARLTRAGVRVFVVSNQAIINRGTVPISEVERINARMLDEIAQVGGKVEAVAFCPHRPDEGCPCRKPKPGLLFELARKHHVDLYASVVVGDALSDLHAGRVAGCDTLLVLTGRGRDQLVQGFTKHWANLQVASDLSDAADLILRRGQAQPDLNPRASRIDLAAQFNLSAN